MSASKRCVTSLMLVMLVAMMSATSAFAGSVRVRGHFRKDGSYVPPHLRSSPDGNPYNNYSYPGNYNPYTGKEATGNEDSYLERNRRPFRSYPSRFVPSQSWSPTETGMPSSPPSQEVQAPAAPTIPPRYEATCSEADRIQIPDNAHLRCNPIVGNFWFCNPGYVRQGMGCVVTSTQSTTINSSSGAQQR